MKPWHNKKLFGSDVILKYWSLPKDSIFTEIQQILEAIWNLNLSDVCDGLLCPTAVKHPRIDEVWTDDRSFDIIFSVS